MSAALTSMALSRPKPTRTTLPAARPAMTERTPSITLYAMIEASRSIARRASVRRLGVKRSARDYGLS
jgi:hypothetical protein